MRDTSDGPQQADDRSHDEVIASLPGYITEMALGADARAHHPQIAAHLDECDSCRLVADELRGLAQPMYAGEVAIVRSDLAFDLSFLTPQPSRGALLWDRIGRLWLQLSAELLDRSSVIGSPAGLAQSWVVARSDARPTTTRPRFHIQERIERSGMMQEVELTLDIYDHGERATLNIRVDQLDQDAFLQENIVLKLWIEQDMITVVTDELGVATFPDIALDRLPGARIEVIFPEP